MELLRNIFVNSFHKFRDDCQDKGASINLILSIALKAPYYSKQKVGITHLILIDMHSRIHFVKIVKYRLVWQKISMLWVNWWNKIVLWHIVRLRNHWILVWQASIKYYAKNINKSVRVGFRIIAQTLEKRLVSIRVRKL